MINKSELVDIRDIKIDTRLPKEERIKKYVKDIKTPNIFKCGEVVVKIKYAENGDSLEDLILGLASKKTQTIIG